MKRRSILWATLLLVTLLLLACKRPLVQGVSDFIARHYAKQTLHAWGLPATAENLALYDAMHAAPVTPPWPKSAATNGVFAGEWSYEQLWATRPLTIGIYSQDPYDAVRFRQQVRIPPDLGARLRLDMLNTEGEFLAALTTHDMVFFCGHANVGRGFFFAPDRGGRGLLPFGNELIAMPGGYRKPTDTVIGTAGRDLLLVSRPATALAQFPVRCKVFWCLTCRSDAYFRDLWRTRYPHCRMVTTHYIWNLGNNVRVLAGLVEGLERRQPLAAIIAHINATCAGDVLLGRVSECREFGNTTNLPPRLLALH